MGEDNPLRQELCLHAARPMPSAASSSGTATVAGGSPGKPDDAAAALTAEEEAELLVPSPSHARHG